MIRAFTVFLVCVLLSVTAATAHPAPAPGTGGWVRMASRPDGLPITHYCGPITFSIDDNGNGGVGVEMRNAVWEMHLITGQEFVEVPPGQVANGFVMKWAWPADAIGNEAGWAKMRNDGWNWTRNDIWINPARFQGPDLRYLAYVIRHELGHGMGMAHTAAPPTVMGQIWSTFQLVDGAGLLYLIGHPAVPGEPCFRAGW